MAEILTSKAPGERIAYLWTPPLATGDTISGTVSANRVSGTATVDGVSVIGGTQVKVWFISGADGETAEFLLTVNTVGGETIEETIYLPVNSTAHSALGAKLAIVFPAFADVPPVTVDYWLTESAIVANWGNDHAQMLLACHYMAINGLGSNPAAGGLTKFKSGTVDMTFSESAANTKGLQATIYGQQFSVLLRRRYAGPRVIAAGVAVDCPC